MANLNDPPANRRQMIDAAALVAMTGIAVVGAATGNTEAAVGAILTGGGALWDIRDEQSQ